MRLIYNIIEKNPPCNPWHLFHRLVYLSLSSNSKLIIRNEKTPLLLPLAPHLPHLPLLLRSHSCPVGQSLLRLPPSLLPPPLCQLHGSSLSISDADVFSRPCFFRHLDRASL